jgi:hypothetical protein
MQANEGLAEGVGFEPTRERNPLPVFKTGALNHSAILPKANPISGLPPRLGGAHQRRNAILARSRTQSWAILPACLHRLRARPMFAKSSGLDTKRVMAASRGPIARIR